MPFWKHAQHTQVPEPVGPPPKRAKARPVGTPCNLLRRPLCFVQDHVRSRSPRVHLRSGSEMMALWEPEAILELMVVAILFFAEGSSRDHASSSHEVREPVCLSSLVVERCDRPFLWWPGIRTGRPLVVHVYMHICVHVCICIQAYIVCLYVCIDIDIDIDIDI